MAAERCTPEIHKLDPRMVKYDWAYYNALLPHITGHVLDIGCGAGMFAVEYAKKEEVTSVVGVDKYTDEMPVGGKIKAHKWGIGKDLPEGTYHTIVSTEFIEHIEREQLEPLLEQIKDKLKNGGVFVGSTPNKISPTTNPYHLYEYTLPELKEIFEKYFGTIQMWDNGQFCTVWVCSVQ